MKQDDAKIGQKVRAMGKSTLGEAHFGRIGEIDMIFLRGTASVKWPEGNTNAFWLADLGPVVEMKIGDRVKVMRAWKAGESRGTNSFVGDMEKHIGEVGTIEEARTNGDCLIRFADGDCWYFADIVLQKVDSKPRAACILTEKVMVGGVKCRKITGFEGIQEAKDLPEKYLTGFPRFHSEGIMRHHGHTEFDGRELHYLGDDTVQKINIKLPENADPKVDSGGFILLLATGDIWPETTFQNILIWLKRAGSRLAKIKRQEHDAWTGREEVSI